MDIMSRSDHILDDQTGLVEQFANGNGAFFIGAGLSMGAGLKGWAELIDALKNQLENCPDYYDFLNIADFYEERFLRNGLIRKMKELIDDSAYTPTVVHEVIAKLFQEPIFTTNYDELIERTLKDNAMAMIIVSAIEAPCRITRGTA